MQHLYYIALDGAADRRIPALGNRTPLEAAETKYLDQMVKAGQMSLISILTSDVTPESDSGAMALLGYVPEEFYCGRGTLECMGLDTYKKYRYFAGFRINLASLSADNGTLDRRTARDLSPEELQALTDELMRSVSFEKWGDIRFELKTFGRFRGILGLYSNTRKLSGNVSNTDPGFVKQGRFSVPLVEFDPVPVTCRPLDDTEAAAFTAALINDFSDQCRQVLAVSRVNTDRVKDGRIPANCVLVRDGGAPPEPMPSFPEKFGKSLAIYGQLPCEKAVGSLIDGTFHYTKAFELQLEEDYLRDLARTLKDEEADVVFCHLKGPDEPGHDRKPLDKKRAIELIDRCFFAELWEPESDHVYIISCDHATPCELGIHSKDPVPLLIAGKNIIPDETCHFDESNALRGGCPVSRATDILDYVIRRDSNV